MSVPGGTLANIGPPRTMYAHGLGASPAARVVASVEHPQPGLGHVRVDLGGADVRVAEHRLERPEIRAVLEQVGREAVPEHVRGDLAADPGDLRPVPQSLP